LVCRFQKKRSILVFPAALLFGERKEGFFSANGAAVSVPVRARKRHTPKPGFLQKPHGRLTPRVQAVGPEHFAILCVDCAKSRSRYLLADFYGTVLLEPTTLPHTRGDFQAAIDRVRAALARHDLRDLVVAVERTGDDHRPVVHAFRAAGWEVRLVHPFATKQYRQPADPGNKTDDTDLAAIFRVTASGFGLLGAPRPAAYQQLQLLRRHRRDLVGKVVVLRCQIREVLHALMPGYAQLFGQFWEHALAMPLARRTGSAAAVGQAGTAGLAALADQLGVRYRAAALPAMVAWAANAPPRLTRRPTACAASSTPRMTIACKKPSKSRPLSGNWRRWWPARPMCCCWPSRA
jgi:hypothetical protein